MKIDVAAVRKCLKSFDFQTLFREHLGWDNHQAQLDIPVDGDTVRLTAVAQKRGFVAFVCPINPRPATRLKIDHQVTKSAREHFVIYADQAAGQQVWQWVRREPGKPLASRDHRFDVSQSGDPLIQRLEQIAVSLEEEESTHARATLPAVPGTPSTSIRSPRSSTTASRPSTLPSSSSSRASRPTPTCNGTPPSCSTA